MSANGCEYPKGTKYLCEGTCPNHKLAVLNIETLLNYVGTQGPLGRLARSSAVPSSIDSQFEQGAGMKDK